MIDLNRELERTKVKAFTDGSNGAFLGSILCNLSFSWDKSIPTAGVSTKNFVWNPDWFESLTKEERVGVLFHELWHIALMHKVRCGDKDPKVWNSACDYKINNDLIHAGYSLPKDGLMGKYEGMVEEDIYEKLIKLPKNNLPIQSWGGSQTPEKGEVIEQVAMVQQAIQQCNACNQAGQIPGTVLTTLKEFLDPKLPWEKILNKYLTELLDIEWSWNKPNKRFSDIYLPSVVKDGGRLTHVALFLDTSGSIDDEQVKRFNSEVKYIQEVLNPEKLTVIQFDTKIQKEDVFTENQQYKNIKVKGRGGTDLECVHDWIVKNKPTCSIIFTDLWCEPMEPVGKLPVIWIIEGDHSAPSFGKAIYV